MLRAAGDYVAARCGFAVEFSTEHDWPQRYVDLEQGALHAAWICGAPYMRLRARGHAVELLAAPAWKGTRYADQPVYFSDIVVRSDSPWQSFEELRGARLASNERGSLSGYECVRAKLAHRGEFGVYFGSVTVAGSHQNGLALILAGEVDAAAIDSTVLEEELRRRPELSGQLRSIHTIGPAPMPPIVALASFPPTARAVVREALTQMHTTDEGQKLLATLPVARFAAVNDKTYAPVRALLAGAEQVIL